ncbi:MAG: TIGR00159 family protein [Anaerolineales bacterium]|nr:TIGR00159 family protein [Anaerolineales bacterium]
MPTLPTELTFFLSQLTWVSLLDIGLVAGVCYLLLLLVRGTQAVTLLRGIILLVAVILVLTTFLPLPGFSWLLGTSLPALLISVPVIFAPEIRRGLERLGRAGATIRFGAHGTDVQPVIRAIAAAAQKLSERQHGALIVIERQVGLKEYLDTGHQLDAAVTAEALLQIFYPNTPMHDGAVILKEDRIVAAGCVMPLTSAQRVEQNMGLRHRAALGISEVSDAVAVVVSEETGMISVAHNGRMIRRLDAERLTHMLEAFYRPQGRTSWSENLATFFSGGDVARHGREPNRAFLLRAVWSSASMFVLSFLLAGLVWFIATSQANPFEERTLTNPLEVALVNLPQDLILVSADNTETNVTLRAPSSVLDRLSPELVAVSADLSTLGAGTYSVPLVGRVDASLTAARVTTLSPSTVIVTLERRASRELPIRVVRTGEPASGYEASQNRLAENFATVVGPTSAVDRVSEIIARVSLTELKTDFSQEVVLIPVDTSGAPVAGVAVTPGRMAVSISITQRAGFREVAVKLNYSGQPAPGYRITNITVAPSIITVSSSDPARVQDLPGFVETVLLNIAGASDDVTQRLALQLPEGVTPVSEPVVLVQVNIAAIESSLQVQRPLEVQNLGAGLVARLSPETVGVFLSGPLPTLDNLQDGDVRVIVNLEGLGVGTYQLTPQVILLPENLRTENLLPSTVEVVLERGAPPTRTLTPTRGPSPTLAPTNTATPPLPTVTPSPTFTPTPTQ